MWQTGTKGKNRLQVLPGKGGEGVLLPSPVIQAAPEFAENSPETRIIRTGKGVPVCVRSTPYLLQSGFDRLVPGELEPPPPDRIIAGSGHTAVDRKYSAPG